MGTWGHGIFDSDMAADLGNELRDAIAAGGAPREVTTRLIAAWRDTLEDPEDGPTAWLALAEAQRECGRLDARVKRRAIEVLEGGGDLARWEREAPELAKKRERVLKKPRTQLDAPLPAAKKIRPRALRDRARGGRSIGVSARGAGGRGLDRALGERDKRIPKRSCAGGGAARARVLDGAHAGRLRKRRSVLAARPRSDLRRALVRRDRLRHAARRPPRAPLPSHRAEGHAPRGGGKPARRCARRHCTRRITTALAAGGPSTRTPSDGGGRRGCATSSAAPSRSLDCRNCHFGCRCRGRGVAGLVAIARERIRLDSQTVAPASR